MTTDLKLAYETIRGKRPYYDQLYRYYYGEQPTVYLTRRLEEIFKGVDCQFTQNWCAVVIDACTERINLRSVTVANTTVQDSLSSVLDDNQFFLEADDVHLNALIFGESYLVIWKATDAPDEPISIYYNDPRFCHIFYRTDQPRIARFAAKMFDGDDGCSRITLYYRDHLEYYVAKKSTSNISSSAAYHPDPEQFLNGTWPANPWDRIPVFHFRPARRVKSDLISVIPPQNGINKLMADMMVAAEYGAFKQRWIISEADVSGKLKSMPGGVWDLPSGSGEGQGTQVGEFDSTDLGNYFNAIDRLAGAIASITRTPRHYFFSEGGDPSGEALIAMEAPLNKKSQDRIDRFSPTWKDAVSFVAELQGTIIAPKEITLGFDKPETVQPKTQADITKVRIDSGIPLEIALKWEGRSDEEIAAVTLIVDKQKKEQAAKLKDALTLAQTNLDKTAQEEGNTPPEKEPPVGKPNATNPAGNA